MIFEHRAFWLPKDVQDPNAYEDAFDVDGARGVAAVCDGVSSSIFSGRWAGILAKAAVRGMPSVADQAALQVWLDQSRATWAASIDESSLAWHQKPKLVDGAATTLLWLQVSGGPGDDGVPRPYRLCCYAIGDCCLFHFRNGQLLQTFPIQESQQFEEHPQVLRSVSKRAEATAFQALESECHPGDLLFVCTDAIAAWTMRQLEAGGNLDWNAYWMMAHEDWQRWVMSLRQEGQIRFDDSTALLLVIGGAKAAPARQSRESDEDTILDVAETKIMGAWKSLRGSLRKGLKDLSESSWLSDDETK